MLAEQNAGGEGLLSTGLLIFALVSLLVAALVIAVVLPGEGLRGVSNR